MPTPHGSRGGMAFSADEVRVLRRALAQALHPAMPDRLRPPGPIPELWAEDVQESLRLTEAIEEAVAEGGRLRAFLLADLGRYRAALPGGAGGYLERLEEAVTDGYLPTPEDLAALRSLIRRPCGPVERSRRSRLAGRCHALAEAAVRERLSLGSGTRHLTAVPDPATEPTFTATPNTAATPVGGRIPMSNPAGTPKTPAPARPQPSPQSPQQSRQPQPHRMPTPAELFGRRTRTAAQGAAEEGTELATGTG
ncbi:hypothetical protein [Kitasatospora sp. NPDC088346]|uniref:hypothetical protein n=1 Tax=Kitasatospora sp. NPDC088346 TaxID=3364073 RepID=UPI00380DF0FB